MNTCFIQVLNNNQTILTGKSHEEVLKEKSSLMAMSSVVIVLLTNLTCTSATELHEILCGVWLDKKIITLIFDNVWSLLPCSLQCLLGKWLVNVLLPSRHRNINNNNNIEICNQHKLETINVQQMCCYLLYYNVCGYFFRSINVYPVSLLLKFVKNQFMNCLLNY